ncbi:hypothetical protein [Agrobacterium pusense]|jgi:hypothetical protein|uniref:hypothetical protein n=1 Tax=Agrobacterium pusense TaxID=648995 RepID=UPI000ED230BB|nr:hypothetical protein [Agrobacterium pusense]NTE81586.1 hypothetical protein [Agrobacterium tumefaciens]HCJ70987.1 hypothetical protein [Agrobacterium sp.]
MASSEGKKKPKKDMVKEYGKVVDAADLDAVHLINMAFDVRPQYFSEKESVGFGYNIDVGTHQYDVDTGVALAFIDCAVTAGIDEDDPLLTFEGHYIVSYKLSEKCDPEAVETFLKRVAVFACYPYFRAMVANLDWAASTSIPPLPVHKEQKQVAVVEKNKKKAELEG